MHSLAAMQYIHGGGYLPNQMSQLSWKSYFHKSVLAGIQDRIALAVSHLGDKAVIILYSSGLLLAVSQSISEGNAVFIERVLCETACDCPPVYEY